MQIRAVLFDLDGTLLDSARDFIAILQQMRQERSLPVMDETLIRQQASAGANAMLYSALQISPADDGFESAKQTFLQRYQKNGTRYSRLFAGLPELLDYLEQQAVSWGIATNKPLALTTPIVQDLQLTQRMAALVCPEHVAQPKPAPDMLLHACRQLAFQPAQCLYIGDDLRDIQAAKAAGMPSMAVGYGYHQHGVNPQDWNADHYTEHSTQLLPRLKSLLRTE